MSNATDIKYRIDGLDGGEFQTLCDAYLCCRGYGTGYSLGMKTGTNKTAKGNPDTYFLSADGKYIFSMCTTQQTDFVNKAIEDIDKCLDSSKTGVDAESVSEIILCYTYGRMTPGEHQQLVDYCTAQNVQLTLIGLDQLGEDIYSKYPKLARDYLNIKISSGQIISIDEFISGHDSNQISAPLQTPFMFRENELQEATTQLESHNVLVVTGPAGVGKTRIALEICKNYCASSALELLCVKSNKLEIYEDIITTIDSKKGYLVFIDDANELAGLYFFLQFLNESKGKDTGIKKIVLTVRDYARSQVLKCVCEYEIPVVQRIDILKDSEIKQLVTKTLGIKNPHFLERISDIAAGNARIALLAGKVSLKTDRLDSIRDATELYDHYYSPQIESIIQSKTGLYSAGLIAFFQTMRLDRLDLYDQAIILMGLTKEALVSDLQLFHTFELVDIRHGIGVKISDQSFSNYLLKCTFIDKKIVPLERMIEVCFRINPQQTIYSCNTILNTFAAEEVHKYMEKQLGLVWDKLQSDHELFPKFFNAFHMIRPTETLLAIKQKIDATKKCDTKIADIQLLKKGETVSITDDCIRILCDFKYHTDLAIAIDLLLIYYQKRPDLFKQFYSAFVNELSIDKDSNIYGYYTQRTIVNQLCATLEKSPSDYLDFLFVKVSEWLLGFCYSSAESGRGHTVIFYTIPLIGCEPLFEYRRQIINQLIALYKDGKYQTDIEKILMHYAREQSIRIDNSIIQHEIDLILSFFSLFSTQRIWHCIVASHIRDVARRSKLRYGNVLTPFLMSKAYRVYHLLSFDRKEWLEFDYETAHKKHRDQIIEKTKNYCAKDYAFLFNTCKEHLNCADNNSALLYEGISIILESASTVSERFVDIIRAYIAADTPYCPPSEWVLEKLFQVIPAQEIKDLLSERAFSQQNQWLWAFYATMSPEQIDLNWAKELLCFLDHPQPSHESGFMRCIDRIKKYEKIDSEFICKAIKTILDHYEESPFLFHLYMHLMLSHESAIRNSLLESNIRLLEDVYTKEVMYSDSSDIHGDVLISIVEKDNSFLDQYLNCIPDRIHGYIRDRESWLNRLGNIWDADEYMSYMNVVSEHFHLRNPVLFDSAIGHVLIARQDNSQVNSRQEEWIHAFINNNCFDKDRIYELFDALSTHGTERRKKALKEFLTLNDDYSYFEHLPLDSSMWDASVPAMRKRIEYLSSLIPILSGVQYIEHRLRVEKEIQIWENRIKEEEIEQLIGWFG